MRNLLLMSCPIAIWGIAAIELVLLVLMYKKYSLSKKPILLCMVLMTIGLFIDALGISIGSVLTGNILTIANRIRFISHALSFGTVIPLMIVGIIVWIKQKTPLLFLSGFLMFICSALGPATGNTDLIFYISMFGEILLIIFLYLYALKKQIVENQVE